MKQRLVLMSFTLLIITLFSFNKRRTDPAVVNSQVDIVQEDNPENIGFSVWLNSNYGPTNPPLQVVWRVYYRHLSRPEIYKDVTTNMTWQWNDLNSGETFYYLEVDNALSGSEDHIVSWSILSYTPL